MSSSSLLDSEQFQPAAALALLSHHLLHPFSPSNPSAASSHAHFAFLLLSHHTEVVLSSYADAVLVLVTQTGKLGSILRASVESSATSPLLSEPSYHVQTLLGPRGGAGTGASSSAMDVLPSVYWLLSRQLMAAIAASGGGEGKALLLCCAIKADCLRDVQRSTGQSMEDSGMRCARTILAQLIEHRVW